LSSQEVTAKQLEKFVNTFRERAGDYREGLQKANERYSHANLIKDIIRR